MDNFYVCDCFFTHNYFLKDFGCHVTYHGDNERFEQEWRQILDSHGCRTKEDFEAVLRKLSQELNRRKNLGSDMLERKDFIAKNYKPLHRHLYTLQDSFLTDEFKELVSLAKQDGTTKDDLQKRMTEVADKVYSFPVFTKKFCEDFIEELRHFEESDMPKGRPNTMNNYGILLNELGFDPDFVTPFREKYLLPISKHFFPDWVGDGLDSHKAFIVSYKMGEDVDLNYHYDNAEVTLNVSLGMDFSQGSLYFCGMRQVPEGESVCVEYEHQQTIGLLHRGQHKHGALPISAGERYNLIIWMRSSSVRNQLCPMCDQKPTLVPTVGYGDGFKSVEEMSVNVCAML